jgi:outer membrane protein assembly factor BamA
MRSARTILFCQFIFCQLLILAQNRNSSARDSSKRYLFTGLPVLFYTPETRLAYGLSGICLFNFKSDSLRAPRSTISLSAVYTQNKQALFTLPFNLFIHNRTYMVYGELTYNKFNYNFYGVGNSIPANFVERYGVEFPRIRLTVLKKLFPHFYAGLRYAYDNYSLYNLNENGLLIQKTIPGSSGGIVSGIGAVSMYDNRDNVFFPAKGWWSELVFYHDDPLTGSSFQYSRIAFDLSRYFNYQKNILALNFYTIYSTTDLPFFQMGTLGGQKRMRGFYEGRYRDNNVLVLQAEYRRMVWGPLGFTLFADAGQVMHRYEDWQKGTWRYTYGAGIRVMVDKTQKITMRLDFAIGNKQMLPYFTIGEAF